jgi:hypothetical protein
LTPGSTKPSVTNFSVLRRLMPKRSGTQYAETVPDLTEKRCAMLGDIDQRGWQI